MTDRVVDFREMSIWIEREVGPFDDLCAGQIVQGHDNYYRFHPSGHVLNCGHLRRIINKVSDLNSSTPFEDHAAASV